ncbi:amino acid transporter [Metarhizobium album]|uniref:Amino acid transporter n=1 Tax=Metarhizobium album TaxID=2182425 RepID=A0A2U2DGZ8_9HYPH|nr:LysE family transporter [Rhizobium album]PWE52538.1 amino acid transporter [Rhizobium album]
MTDSYMAFLIFVAVATFSPGGATTLATASGMLYGFRRSVPFIVGIGVGLGLMAVASALGLAALLLALPAVEFAVSVTGSIYLLYLAWKIATNGSPSRRPDASAPVSLWGAIGLTWYNPKAWAITMGASSSFADLVRWPPGQVALIGATFMVFATASMALWCTTGHALAQLLKSDWQWQVLNLTMALLLAASIIPLWLE